MLPTYEYVADGVVRTVEADGYHTDGEWTVFTMKQGNEDREVTRVKVDDRSVIRIAP